VSAGHPGVITGVVRDESGAPVEHARVYVVRAPAPTPDVAALTGADGRFSIAAPVDGIYTLESVADGFAAAQTTLDSRDGADVQVTLEG
jgi:hypothetical protein